VKEEVNNQIFCLDPSYSTTRRLNKIAPVVENLPGSKFQSLLFLPFHSDRKGVGGLRLQGHFKARSCQGFEVEEKTHTEARPLITVITAVFNGGKALEQSILSVINQSYDNIEYIIIDGDSTDETLDIIRRYEHAIDYWVSEPDGGIYDAWNKGIRLATGDWIAFMGADDIYLAGAINSYVELLTDCRDRRLEYISSRVNLTTGTKVIRTVGEQWRWKYFQKYMNTAHVGSLHSRKLFQKYGLYDISYKICGDYEFLLRPGSGLRTAFLDSITVNMGIGGKSDNSLMAFREVERAKVTTGGKIALISHLERFLAVGKWKLRKRLWY
jgi:glycosyltransferase involved in cell wall biosynthesis